MKEIAEQRRRFGYRRIGVLLAREGMVMNEKKLYRLYTEERLAVKRRKGRKRTRGPSQPMPPAAAPNARWSLDFVSDTYGASRRFRILAVVDDCTRESIGLVSDTSIGGTRDDPRLREACLHRQRQRDRVHFKSHARMARPRKRRLALHRSRQAPAKRLQRKLQRPPARRMPERDMVRQSCARAPRARTLAL
jgi:hypothetical protein